MAKNRFTVDFLFGAKKQGSFDKTFSSISKSVKSLTKTVAGVAATYVSAKALADVGNPHWRAHPVWKDTAAP